MGVLCAQVASWARGKTPAPGMRLGWAVCPPLVNKIGQVTDATHWHILNLCQRFSDIMGSGSFFIPTRATLVNRSTFMFAKVVAKRNSG